MTICCAVASANFAAAEGGNDEINVQFRRAFIEGMNEGHRFVLQENGKGFAELQDLFLASLSSAESIELCCLHKHRQRITLNLRSPYYVHLGQDNVLIKTLEIAWPEDSEEPAHLVLNENFVIHPAGDSQSFNLLAEWAHRRGYY